MNVLIILIIVLLVVIVVLVIALREAKKYGTKTKDELVGICTISLDRSTKRQGNLDKIVSLFATDSELTNTEIRGKLSVSSRTAVRYMDELEKAGKVIQIGKIGYNAKYRLK